jgi:dual specificity phosphatase 12
MMGKSRSATLVCAYIMNKELKTPKEALEIVRSIRAIAEPNEGFMKQLELYHQMGAPDDVENQPIYQRWLFERSVQQSIEIGQAPEKIRFEDESSPAEGDASVVRVSCRKCRRTLASSAYILSHTPKEKSATQNAYQSIAGPISTLEPSSLSHKAATQCAHIFVDPLSWMRSELEQGKLDGRLECPKCKSNVGKYAWQGMRCSCGKWVLPAISLSRSRVDEVGSKPGGLLTRGVQGKM